MSKFQSSACSANAVELTTVRVPAGQANGLPPSPFGRPQSAQTFRALEFAAQPQPRPRSAQAFRDLSPVPSPSMYSTTRPYSTLDRAALDRADRFLRRSHTTIARGGVFDGPSIMPLPHSSAHEAHLDALKSLEGATYPFNDTTLSRFEASARGFSVDLHRETHLNADASPRKRNMQPEAPMLDVSIPCASVLSQTPPKRRIPKRTPLLGTSASPTRKRELKTGVREADKQRKSRPLRRWSMTTRPSRASTAWRTTANVNAIVTSTADTSLHRGSAAC